MPMTREQRGWGGSRGGEPPPCQGGAGGGGFHRPLLTAPPRLVRGAPRSGEKMDTSVLCAVVWLDSGVRS